MSNDNTKPEFFALWSIRELQVECARLNQVLSDTQADIDQIIVNLSVVEENRVNGYDI